MLSQIFLDTTISTICVDLATTSQVFFMYSPYLQVGVYLGSDTVLHYRQL